MTTTSKNTAICPHCNASGKVGIGYQWSDHYSVQQHDCPACAGTGEIDLKSLITEVLEGRNAKSDLDQLRTHCALFVGCEANEGITDPGDLNFEPETLKLKLAPRPSCWPSTWREQLKKAGSLAPRQ